MDIKAIEEWVTEKYASEKMTAPMFLHARNPVEAIHWWGLLSAVLGSASEARYDRLGSMTGIAAPGHWEDETTFWKIAVSESQRMMTPERAVEVRDHLKSLLGDRCENHSVTCAAIGDRVPRTEYLRIPGAFGIIPAKSAVITIPSPDITRDSSGVLHSDPGPAVSWDGYGIYFLHGVRLTQQQMEGDLTFQDFLKIRNSEVRRVLVERKGWDWLASHLTPRDSSADPGNPGRIITLYDLPGALARTGRWGSDRRLVIMTNASPSRDGSERTYGEFVPATVTTALEAQAWGWNVPVRVYKSMMRAT